MTIDKQRREALEALGAAAGLALGWPTLAHAQGAPRSIERVKESLVAVGTVQRLRAPPFEFSGTGFVIGDGTLVATNAHVLSGPAQAQAQGPQAPAGSAGSAPVALAVVLPSRESQAPQVREARAVAVDPAHDLAILKISGSPLPALTLAGAELVSEGESLLFSGFPLGTVLGVFPATHRAMVAAVTPVAIPPASARQLDPRTIRRLQTGPFPIYQLDATAYPGNSGSPLYLPASGEVVGVLNMVFVKGTKESALSAPSGISYAIPVRYLRELLAQVK
jgi:S1-C subfamily serine protease